MTRLASMFVLALLQISAPLAQQEVTFPAAKAARAQFEGEIEAVLHLPTGVTGKVPAVVFIHSAGGFLNDRPRYDFYASVLRQAGIATLYVNLFRAGSDKLPSYWLSHAFGALKYLAAHPQIASDRIGIMGISLGGILSMYTASARLSTEFLGDGVRYAAHVPIYPVCWIHEEVARGSERTRKALGDPYAKLTGAPVHILAGGRDELDDPDGCQKFLELLSPDARKFVGLTVYPEATHVWDDGRSFRYFDRAGCKGKGCYVTVEANPEVAAKGRQFVVEFFSKHLQPQSK